MSSVGFVSTSEKIERPRPALYKRSNVLKVISSFAKPLSVTSKGFVIPIVLHASAISTIRPAPKRIEVGYDQFAINDIILFHFY